MSLLNNSQSDAKRYQASAEDLSYRELRFAGWYVRNKTKVANVGIATLLVWCILSVGYSLVMLTLYLAIGMPEDERMVAASVRQFQDYRVMQPRFAPASLILGDTVSRVENDEKRAYITEVRNPNSDWIATVRFRYPADDTSQTFTQVLLPQSKSILADLGGPNTARTVRLEMVDIDWQRLNAHVLPDPALFMNARLRGRVSDVVIDAYDAVQETPARVSFDLTNESAYGYWEARYYILFFSGERVTVVRPLLIDTFEPGASERIEFNFGRERLGITDIEVLPNINVFDPDVYLPITSNSL